MRAPEITELGFREVVVHVLAGEEVANRTEGIVHLETQSTPSGLDLTVDSVLALTGPGDLDFGGGEFSEADCRKLDPKRRSSEDDYGWWTLESGHYLIRYNERLDLPDREFAVVRPLGRLMRAGASHDSVMVQGCADPLTVLVAVGSEGANWKENARVSRVQVYSPL